MVQVTLQTSNLTLLQHLGGHQANQMVVVNSHIINYYKLTHTSECVKIQTLIITSGLTISAFS